MLLLTSAGWVTYAHHSLLRGVTVSASLSLALTIVIAAIFTTIQLYEYQSLSYSIDHSVFATTFYTLTGLHGLHVVAGTVYLATSLFRLSSSTLTVERHLHLEAAA